MDSKLLITQQKLCEATQSDFGQDVADNSCCCERALQQLFDEKLLRLQQSIGEVLYYEDVCSAENALSFSHGRIDEIENERYYSFLVKVSKIEKNIDKIYSYVEKCKLGRVEAPSDISDEIEKISNSLDEALKMYETLEEDGVFEVIR